MISLILAMLRARRGQAWTLGLLALFATASAIAGPAYLAAVDRAVVNHEVAGASPAERSLSTAAVVDNQGFGGGTSFPNALYTLVNLPGFTSVLAENYVVLGLEAGPNSESQFDYRQGACDHLVIVAGRCMAGAGEIVIGEATAKRRAIAPGTVITITYAEITDPRAPVYQPVGTPAQVTVVGTYRPRDPGELYWGSGSYFALTAAGTPAEPVFTSRYTFESLDHRQQLVSIDSFADPGTLVSDQLDTVVAELKSVTDGLTDLNGSVQSQTGIPDLVARIHSGQHLAHQVVPVAAVPLVLLAWFVIFLAVGYGAEARQFELGLVALRGVRLPTRWWLAVGENIIPIVLGAAGGFVVGQVTVALLARARLGATSNALVSTAGWQYALAAGLGAVLCALLAQRRGIATPVASLLRRVVRPAPAWRAIALELLVVALAVVAAVQLQVSGGDLTGVSLLVPGLVILAVALLAGRAVIPLAARYGSSALRHGRTGTGLAALQLARRPGAQRLLVLLTAAVGLLAFAVTATDVAAVARANEAQIDTGAVRVVTVSNVTRLQLLQQVRAIDPQGRYAMAAVRIPQGGPDEPPELAVDTARLARVASWRADFGSLRPADLVTRLHPTSSGTIVLRGTTLTLNTAASGFDPRAGLHLELNLAPVNGDQGFTVDLGTLIAGEHAYPSRIEGCASGCRLVGLTVHQGSLGGYQVVLVLHSLVLDSGATGVDEAAFARTANWLATPSAQLTGGADGLTMNLDNTSGLVGNAWLRPNDSPYPLPVVSTEQLPAEASIGGLGTPVPVHQVGRIAGLPGLGDYGTYVDLEYADRVASDSGAAEGAEIWLGPAAPANVIQLLTQHGLIVREDHTVADRRAGLDGQGPALALWFHLLAAAFAVILATGGIGLVAGVDRQRRTEDLAALRAQGLRRRVSSRAGLWGYLVVVLAALVCGVAAAAVAWWVTGPDLPVLEGAAHWPLPHLPRAVALLLPLLGAGALFALVSWLAAVALRRSVARTR